MVFHDIPTKQIRDDAEKTKESMEVSLNKIMSDIGMIRQAFKMS